MRREARIAQRQERWLAQQEERRQRKMKTHSLPGRELCHAPGADAAAVDGEVEGMKTAKAAAAIQSVAVVLLRDGG